jgi:hypothetical protein
MEMCLRAQYNDFDLFLREIKKKDPKMDAKRNSETCMKAFFRFILLFATSLASESAC